MLNMLGVSPYLQGTVKGIVIIGAVYIQKNRVFERCVSDGADSGPYVSTRCNRRFGMKKVLTVLFAPGRCRPPLLRFGCPPMAQAEKLKIGYSMPAATHGYMARAIYWAKKGMADEMAKDPNVEFLFVTADNVTKQANDIEDLIQKGINALIVFPFDASVTSVVEKAYKAGIYVLVMDRGTSKPVYDMYMSNDDEGYTRNGMEWLCKQLEYKGKVVIIEGIPCPINTVRIESIKKVAAQYAGVEILDSQPGEWNRQKALAVMENYLQKYKEIDAVYTADDDMMFGALQAYRESGRKRHQAVPGRRLRQERHQVDHGRQQSSGQGERDLSAGPVRHRRGPGRDGRQGAELQRPVSEKAAGPDHPVLRTGDQGKRQRLLLPRRTLITGHDRQEPSFLKAALLTRPPESKRDGYGRNESSPGPADLRHDRRRPRGLYR